MSETLLELPPPIGESPPFLSLMERVSRAAPLDRPVLVIGERGTGKELIAARLHYLSRRWERPLVAVNCAALSESLLESELFGHEAGAFTGAQRRRIGRFERADGGTLFLDEIANASLPAQEKILRVIEYGGFERVGGDRAVFVDTRVVCATNLDLPAEAAAGRFRLDLLDRLAFDVLTVPPLRARRGDIVLLADHFRQTMMRDLGRPERPFTEAALDRLRAYPWPGNVRELKNVVERAVYRAADPGAPISALIFDPFASPYRPPTAVAPDPAPAPVEYPESSGQPLDFRAVVAGVERRLLAEALAACRHNQRAAARHLGLSYDQFRNGLRKHGLATPRRRGEKEVTPRAP